jgi:hypothetical protein
MQFETTYKYSQELVKKAYRYYMWRSSLGFHIGMLAFGALGFYLLFSERHSGFGGFCLGVSVYYLYGWIEGARRAKATPQRLADQEIRLKISEEELKFETNDFCSTAKWSAITAIWKFHEIWLLFIDYSGHYTIIPTSPLSDSAKSLMEQKVLENKGRVA